MPSTTLANANRRRPSLSCDLCSWGHGDDLETHANHDAGGIGGARSGGESWMNGVRTREARKPELTHLPLVSQPKGGSAGTQSGLVAPFALRWTRRRCCHWRSDRQNRRRHRYRCWSRRCCWALLGPASHVAFKGQLVLLKLSPDRDPAAQRPPSPCANQGTSSPFSPPGFGLECQVSEDCLPAGEWPISAAVAAAESASC